MVFGNYPQPETVECDECRGTGKKTKAQKERSVGFSDGKCSRCGGAGRTL